MIDTATQREMRTPHRSVSRAAVWMLACLIAGSAAAQPAPLAPGAAAHPTGTMPVSPYDDDEVRPWAQGVPEAEQAIAREAFALGNAEFAESRFAQALTKYREAIKHWDHPAIRFNMAVCLINLGQLLEARDDLERGLAYGAAPLGSESYAQGLTYRTLLDGQLAHVEATCSEAGAVVTLDGKVLFTAPGSTRQHMLPGAHQLTAAKPGFRTAEVTFDAAAGKPVRYELQPLPELAQRRWRYWKHLLAAGGAAVGAAALTYLAARSAFADYDDAVTAACKETMGCSADQARAMPQLRAKKDRADTEQTVAVSLFAVGGAAVVVAVLGLIVDQPRTRPEPGRAVPVVTAVPGGATIALGWSY